MSSKYIIPEGTRDLILGECKNKKKLQEKIEKVLDKWGYKEVVTPTIEFYQTFNSGFQNLKEEEVYKFFDGKGRILVLRPDMTIPIARVVATKFKDKNLPLRFRYTSDVFRSHKSLGGKRNEYTDCGIELIGLNNEESDLEVLVTALDVLELIKNKEYKLEIGNMDFYRSAVESLNLNEEQEDELATLIDRKSLKELEDYLLELNVSKEYKDFFLDLPWLFGGKEVLDKAKKYFFNDGIKKSINYLEKLYDELDQLGYGDVVTFDLGMIPRLNYYTGITFRGFADGVGANVLSGGRYDKLIATFGCDVPAIGFSVNLDTLIEEIDFVDESQEKYVITYGENNKIQAIKECKKLQKQDKVVELVPVKGNADIEIKKEV